MKKSYFILGITMIFLSSCGQKASNAASDPNASTKEIAKEMAAGKTYIVEYKTVMGVQGMNTSSVSKHWIDIKNDRMAIETETTTDINGQKSTQKSLIIDKDGYLYSVNLADNTCMKMSNDDDEGDDPTDDIKSDDDEAFRQSIEKEGGKVVGNETFLGKNCIVVAINSEGEAMKMWYYKGIPLKIESKVYSMEATKFEEGVSIPKSKFEIPQGVTMRKLPNF